MDEIEQDKIGERIERDSLEKGDTVVVEWSPYEWAKDSEGYVQLHEVEVVGVDDSTGDIKLKAPDGKTMRDLGSGRYKVMGPSENHPGVPDYTDVGTGVDRYYRKTS